MPPYDPSQNPTAGFAGVPLPQLAQMIPGMMRSTNAVQPGVPGGPFSNYTPPTPGYAPPSAPPAQAIQADPGAATMAQQISAAMGNQGGPAAPAVAPVPLAQAQLQSVLTGAPAPVAPRLGPAIAAAQQPAQTHVAFPNTDGTVTLRPIENPALHQAAVEATGGQLSDQAIQAIHEPHNFSEEDFVNAVRGQPWGMVKSLWSMQHYLTPEQQLLPHFMDSLTDNVTKAQAQLQNAKSPDEIKKAQAVLAQTRGRLSAFTQEKLLGIPWYAQQQAEQQAEQQAAQSAQGAAQ